MTAYRIPFNRACFVGQELSNITEAIRLGHISGDGGFTKKCEKHFESSLGVMRALLTTSCTHALEMSAILMDLNAGDEVIVPSFTFVSTVNAFVLRGARPIFCDVRVDTLNLDESKLEKLISPRTKAIVVVHYAGVGCEMDSILAIAKKHGVPVIEDNAHGLFGSYKGRLLGTLGSLATLSFHETKNITCGEGGALLINDRQYIERAEIIREKGTNRARFFRGQVDKYTWSDLGSSYVPSDLLAAFLHAQLEGSEQIQSQRKRIWHLYRERLTSWAEQNQIKLPFVPDHCQQAYHMFYLILPSLKERQRLIEHLKLRSILSVFHYVPLHLSKMGRQFGGKENDCPVCEDVSDRLVRLPFFNSLGQHDQEEVIDAVRAFEVTI